MDSSDSVIEADSCGPFALKSEEQTLIPTRDAVWNQINYILSLVIIGTPFVFYQAGWVGALLLYGIYLVVMSQTARWLCRAVEVAGKGTEMYPAASTPDLIRIVYGEGFITSAVRLAFFLDLFGTLVISVTVIAESVLLLLPKHWGEGYASTDTKIFALPLLIVIAHVPLERLSVTSLLGTFCALGVFSTLVYNGFTKQEQPGSLIDVEHMPTRLWPISDADNIWQGLIGSVAVAMGIVVTTTSGHAGLPRMYMALQDRRKRMPAWINWGFAVSVAVMMLAGGVGFAMFGDATREAITDNLNRVKGHKTLNMALTILIALIPFTTFPLYIEPIVLDFELLFLRRNSRKASPHREISYSSVVESSSNPQGSKLRGTGTDTPGGSMRSFSSIERSRIIPDLDVAWDESGIQRDQGAGAGTFDTNEAHMKADTQQPDYHPSISVGESMGRTYSEADTDTEVTPLLLSVSTDATLFSPAATMDPASPRQVSSVSQTSVRTGLRILITVMAVAVSILLPSFAGAVALVGAMITGVTDIIIPAACFITLFGGRSAKSSDHESATRGEIVWAWILLFAGAASSIFATVGIIGRIVVAGFL